MRIGIFTDTYTPFINGVTTSVVMLKNALEKKGHTVYIVTVNHEDLKFKYKEDEKIIRIPGVPIGIYDYRLTGIYPLKAINKIKKWNLDVIHSQTEFGVGTFARIIAKQFNIPLVHTYHTMYEDYIHYITKGYFKKSSKKLVEYFTLFYCDKTISELVVEDDPSSLDITVVVVIVVAPVSEFVDIVEVSVVIFPCSSIDISVEAPVSYNNSIFFVVV